MITNHTIETLKAFELGIAEAFNAGKITAPVHLEGGNEEQLIEIFQEIKPEDYVLGSWRSHLKCLLKGVPPEKVRAAILAGRSITLCFPAQRVLTSAIVGGVLPIAVGLAMGLKRREGQHDLHKSHGLTTCKNCGRRGNIVLSDSACPARPKVWVFVGDMTMRTGAFHEALNYAAGHNLPICFVIEDNGISVCTPTAEVWGQPGATPAGFVRGYRYQLPWPHSGAGKRVEF